MFFCLLALRSRTGLPAYFFTFVSAAGQKYKPLPQWVVCHERRVSTRGAQLYGR